MVQFESSRRPARLVGLSLLLALLTTAAVLMAVVRQPVFGQSAPPAGPMLDAGTIYDRMTDSVVRIEATGGDRTAFLGNTDLGAGQDRLPRAVRNQMQEGFANGRRGTGFFFDNIGQRLIQLIFEATLVQNILNAVTAGIGSLGSDGGGGQGPEIFHSGGIAGRAAQRRPFGRAMLRPGERLAIILDDEEVLTSRDPRHRWNVRSQSYEDLRAYISRLPRHHEGRGPVNGQSGATMGAAPMNVRFELINETASPARAVDGGNRFDGDTFVQTVILRDFRASGPISQAVKSLPRR